MSTLIWVNQNFTFCHWSTFKYLKKWLVKEKCMFLGESNGYKFGSLSIELQIFTIINSIIIRFFYIFYWLKKFAFFSKLASDFEPLLKSIKFNLLSQYSKFSLLFNKIYSEFVLQVLSFLLFSSFCFLKMKTSFSNVWYLFDTFGIWCYIQ